MGSKLKHLYQILQYWADVAENDIYVTTDKESITFSYTWNYSLSVAISLKKIIGFRPVVIKCNDPINFIIALWGILINGSDVYFSETKKNFYILNDSIVELIRKSVLASNQDSLCIGHDLSIYMNSSGTTYEPHLIRNTEKQFIDSLISIKRYSPMSYLNKRGYAYISVRPTHSYGLSSIIEYTFSGYRLFMPYSFELINQFKSLLKNIGQINTIAGTPFLIQSMLHLFPNLDFSSLKQIILGTDMIPLNLLEELLERNRKMEIICRYGLSELPSVVSASIVNIYNIHAFSPQLLTSCLDIYKLKYNSYDAYNELIIVDSYGNHFKTGDNVSCIKNGFLLQGRCSSIFKYNGYKVNSILIEQELKKYHSISDCILFLDSNKLILKVETSKKLTTSDIVVYWQQLISAEFFPDRILIVDKIDRTTTGKKLRYIL